MRVPLVRINRSHQKMGRGWRLHLIKGYDGTQYLRIQMPSRHWLARIVRKLKGKSNL